MLVLTRKIGEGIAIGENIKVIVMQVKGKQVRLGIKADASTQVHREEVFEKIQEENRLASMTQKSSIQELHDLVKTDLAESVGQSVLRKKTDKAAS